MKKLFYLLTAAVLLLTSCREYDDSELIGRVDNLEERVTRLETLCNQMNTNITSLQTIVSALQQNDYITSVTPITEGDATIGYTITFTKSAPITIYHGKNGKDGENGKDGTDGKDGVDGKDGYTPVIGVRQDTDGIYYWTLDGEWLLDADGNKIKAVGVDGKDGADGKDGVDGKDGKDGVDGINGADGKDGENGKDGADGKDGVDGKDGADGKDGITPQLKIEDDYWYISYDNGATWTQLGKATGEDGQDGTQGEQGIQGPQGEAGLNGDSFFQSVTQDESKVYFTLADGTVITIPKGLALSISFAEADLVVMSPNSTREIGYTVTSMTETVTVEVTSSADIKAKVVADDESGLTGKIHITTSATIDEYSKVIVFVSNGDKVIMRSITFEEAGLVVEENTTKQATAEGGEMTLEFLSNVECEVIIPEEAQSWISVVPATRAMERQTITLKLEPNTGYNRSASVTVQSPDGTLNLEYQVEQNGDLGIDIDPTQIPNDEIWYRTTDGQIYNINCCTEIPFDVNVISNTYQNGIGVIKCDGTIRCINVLAFRGYHITTNNITELYLPNCVETISDAAIEGTELTTLHIPANLKQYGGNSNLRMEKFTGKYVSEDGRCVIIDNKLCAFAPKGLKEYIIPQGIKAINNNVFGYSDELQFITLSEGLEHIGDGAFNCCYNLTTITFPSTLTTIGRGAFESCSSIEGFYGNEKFHTSDNRCLIYDYGYPDEPDSYGKWIQFFAGKGVADYTIPEGIVGIDQLAFAWCPNLKTLTLPNSLTVIASGAFGWFDNGLGPQIEAVYGSNTSEDNRCFVMDGELKMFVAKNGVTRYVIPDDIKSVGNAAFSYCFELEELVMGDNITQLGPNCFVGSPDLKSVTLSANLERILGNPFENCGNLQSVYLRSLVPPLYLDLNMHGISEKLQILIPSQSLAAYQHVGRMLLIDTPWGNFYSPYGGWNLYREYLVGYNYTDHPTPDLYISSDYSADGNVTTLQTATKGDGIDIVLMGDAYSDRQIADGTYKADMESLYNNLFTEEPYKSFKDHFNVYYVKVVSITEGYGLKGANGSVLGGYFGDGTLVGGNENAVFNYALKAISEEEMDEALIIVAMNSDNYAGTCYMYYPESVTGTYGSGPSVSYFPKGGDATTFAQLLHHEACGHGFAKLADEYAYEDMGTAPSDYVSQIKEQQTNWGWWKNVDFTNNPLETRWSHFINDTRYANEGLGAYEGGLTYWSGVWRPTENSIMRYNTGGFNAPSREAIYYRIHKLAYGDSWEYDYEEFVEWDARNRTAEATIARAKSRKPTNYKPTHPPVFVNKSWRDAK